MNCPHCAIELTEMKVEEVVLDRCPRCGGIWFDFALLERVLSRETRSLKTLIPETPPDRFSDVETMTCPRCAGTLIRLHGSPEEVIYYGCLTCYGRWLDSSEIELIVGRSLAVKFETLFQKLLG